MRNKDSVSFTMDQDGARVELANLNLEESNKIIGTFLRHGRSNKAIKNYMLNKIEKWLELTKKGVVGQGQNAIGVNESHLEGRRICFSVLQPEQG